MPSFLRNTGLALLLSTGFATGHLAAEEQGWAPAEPETVTLEDLEQGQLQAFASAYHGVITIVKEYEEKFAEVGDDANQASALQQEVNEQLIQVIDDQENLSIQDYNVIITSMGNDPELYAAIRELMPD